MERLATRGQDRQLRAVAQQAGDDRRRLGHLLEVVEDDQHPALAEVVGELVLEIALDDLAQPDGARDRHEDGIRVADAGQVDEGHAVRGTGAPGRSATRMASVVLPVPPGPVSVRRRTDPVRQAIGDLRDLVGPADQRGDPRRQVGARAPGGDQRRELRRQVRVDELVQVLGAPEVPQVVLAEVEEAPHQPAAARVASAPADAESSTWPP